MEPRSLDSSIRAVILRNRICFTMAKRNSNFPASGIEKKKKKVTFADTVDLGSDDDDDTSTADTITTNPGPSRRQRTWRFPIIHHGLLPKPDPVDLPDDWEHEQTEAAKENLTNEWKQTMEDDDVVDLGHLIADHGRKVGAELAANWYVMFTICLNARSYELLIMYILLTTQSAILSECGSKNQI